MVASKPTLSPITVKTVAMAMKLNNLEFTYFPMTLLSLMINNMSINTNGSNRPFATWERNKIVRSGTLGIIIIITASIISPR